MSETTDRVRRQLAHAKDRRMLAVAIDLPDVEALLGDLREAERYINRLRVPLLNQFGTDDPELIRELYFTPETLNV